MKRVICLFLCITTIFVFNVKAYAKQELKTVLKDVATVYENQVVVITHENSYWRGKSRMIYANIRIYEEDIVAGLANGGRTSASKDAYLDVSIPSKVTQLLNEGANIKWEIEENGASLSSIFKTIPSSGTYQSSNTVLRLPASLYFNFSSLKTLNDYVAGLSYTIPLVDSKYGINVYTLFLTSTSKADAESWWEEGKAASYVKSPFFSPYMILNTEGVLRSGYDITIKSELFEGGSIVSSSNYKVGKSNLASGSPCSYKFYFPFAVHFYREVEELVEVDDPVVIDTKKYRLHRLK